MRQPFFRLAVAIVCAAALRLPASAQPHASSDPIFDTLADLVTAKMREHHVPGAALGVLRDGRAEIRAFGVRSVEDPQPITNDTVFPLASISKTFSDAIDDLVFGPIGLKLAFTRVGDIAVHRFALGHRASADGVLSIVKPFTLGSTLPAGGTAMAMTDLLEYVRFHLGDGTNAA